MSVTSKPSNSGLSDSASAMTSSTTTAAVAPRPQRNANSSDGNKAAGARALNDSSGTVLQRSGLQSSGNSSVGLEEEGGTLAGWKFDDNMLKTYDVKTSVSGWCRLMRG